MRSLALACVMLLIGGAALGQSLQAQLEALAMPAKPRLFSPVPDRLLFSGQAGCQNHRPRDESGSMCYGACANPELFCDTIGNRCGCR